VEKLQGTLERLGSADLASLLGEETMELVELLGLKHVTPARLATLVISQRGPQQLLLDKPTRLLLLDALKREDAERIARLLQLQPSDDPWKSIRNVGFSSGSPSTQTLLAFFGCPAPQENEQEKLSNPIELLEPTYGLFNHQIDACREVISFLVDSQYPRVMLHMPTGSGKTRTAMNVISYFLRHIMADGEVVVWLAHSEELCEQAAEEFEKAWRILGNRQLSVYRCFGPYRIDFDSVRNGILVGSLQLLYQRSLTNQGEFLDLARRVPLVVMDEAHQAIAPTYKHLLDLLAGDPRTAVLGLSATPGRSWLDASEDMRLAQFFNRQKVTLRVEGYENPVEYLQTEGYLAKAQYEYLHFSGFELLPAEAEKLRVGLDLPDSVIARLSTDHRRNLLILTSLMKVADNGGKILVFACTVEHAHLLADLMCARGYAAAAITSKTRADRRRHLIAQYRDTEELQVLTNYGVLTAGFDAPRTNVAMITRPTQSVVLYSQMVGRAARGPLAGGNPECLIITVVDQIPGFRSIAEGFSFWEDIWT
jgi:superfamily II DNA or RNA helicase